MTDCYYCSHPVDTSDDTDALDCDNYGWICEDCRTAHVRECSSCRADLSTSAPRGVLW